MGEIYHEGSAFSELDRWLPPCRYYTLPCSGNARVYGIVVLFMEADPKSWLYRVLRALEPYVKTDLVYLAKGGSLLFINQVVSALAMLALAVVFANLVPKEVYGQYKYILSLAGLLTTFSLTGLAISVVQSVAEGNHGEMPIAFRASLKGSIPMAIVGFLSGAYYFVHGNHTLGLSLLITAIALPFWNASLLYQSFLNGIRDFFSLTTYAIARTVFPIPFLIGIVLITHNVVAIIFTYYTTNALISLYLYLRTLKRYPATVLTGGESIRFGTHLSIMGILGGLAEQIDSILVFHYLGAAELALYTFATALPEQIRGVLKNSYSLMLPKLSARSVTETKTALPRRLLQVTFLTVSAVVAYALVAPIIFHAFFPKYIEAIPYSQIYAIMIIFSTAGIIPMTSLQVTKNHPRLYVYNVIAQIGTIGILFTGIMLGGFMGMIISRIVSEAFKLIVVIVLFATYKDISAESI